MSELRRDKLGLEEGGSFRFIAKVGDTIRIQDQTETDVMTLESHSARHASGGADALPSASISNEMLQDYSVTSRKIATGEVKVTNFVDHLGQVGPIPDVATWYATHYTLPAVPRQAIVTPTTAGVKGYVMVSSLATTGVQLTASVSGVYAIVSLIL